MLRRYLIAAFCLIAAAASAAAQSPATRELAPSGRLRVALIGSNPVLVTRSADGKAGGVSVVLGEFIAAKLGLPFEPVVYATPAAYTESFGKGEWDLGIGAKDASRAEKLDFSPDFMLVDNVFVAAPGRNFADAAAVDRPGVKVAVGKNNAADHFLTGALKTAEIVRIADDLDSAVTTLKTGAADVIGVNVLAAYRIADRLSGAAVVPGQYNIVHMAVAVPKGRSPAALAELSRIVREANGSGVVANAITDAGLPGVRPAPQ
jgi:polar amino acid transport system substrate-binding protein